MDAIDRPQSRPCALPSCELCGDRVGVYEPVVASTPTGWRTTSLAAEPELGTPELRCRHLACAELAD